MNSMDKELKCDYRSIGNYLMIAVMFPFLCFMIYVSVRFKNVFLWGVSLAAFLILLYYVLQMLNRKVILTEDYIIEYSMLGKVRQHNVYDITQITVCNGYRDRYILIKLGMKKIKIQKQARRYDMFETRLCKMFNLKGYSQNGTHIYDL